jgi:uncharacterized protein YccT (UPF0319 family)
MKNILILFMLILEVSCTSLQSRTTLSNHVEKIPGKKAFVGIMNDKNDRIEGTTTGAQVMVAAKAWLSNKGYEVVQSQGDADVIVGFQAHYEPKQIYVPGSTRQIPVYGNMGNFTGEGKQYNSVVKDDQGQTIGTIQSTEKIDPLAVTGYRTETIAGYNANVAERWISLDILVQSDGKREFANQVVVGPKNYSDEFYESGSVMEKSTEKLLNESILKSTSIAGN